MTQVLCQAHDERATKALEEMTRGPSPGGRTRPLSVDVGLAQELAESDTVCSTGLTPALAASSMLRMSPRMGNKYHTGAILSLGGAGQS